jgi:cytoskeletal protein CcmA (bactofilin family)
MAFAMHEGKRESRIGADTKITGKLNFVGRTSIEGEAEGEIRGEDIVIAAGANVKARLSANRLSIAGCVSGDIVAHERVELLQGARARGTITTPKLVISEGAQFEGDCKMPH